MSNPSSRFTTIFGSWLGLGIVGLISGLMVTVMMTPVIAVSGIAIKNTLSVFDALPDFIEIGRQAQKNEIYVQKTSDKDDGYIKIADVYWQNREEIPLSQMSQFLKMPLSTVKTDAFLSTRVSTFPESSALV